MKRLSYILGGIAIGALLFVGVSAHAQVTANYWKLSAGTILPNIASWTLTLPYLPSQNCIGTDSNGLLQAGTCGSGGTNYFTNSGINTYLNTGSNLEAPSLSATSTIATSTFSGDVWIGSTGVLPNPDLRIGTSAVPLYGRVLGDVIDAEYDYNGVSSINVANANIGTCAASTYFADGNNPTLGGYYGTFSFLNDGWTNGGGAGCGISASNTDKPEAVVIGSPTGEIDNDIASTSNNGFADFNWNVNNVNKMKLTNGGNLGIGTTSPFATLSVMVGDSYLKQPPSTAFAIGSSSVGTATSTLFNVLSSGNVGIGTSSPYSLLSIGGNVVIGASTAGGTMGTLTVSGLGAGIVQSSATGVFSSAALTSGQVTTALGFTPFGGTNPLPIANGGTNAASFTTSGNTVSWNGTSLITSSLTSPETTPFASSTALSVSGTEWLNALGTPAGAFLAVDPNGKIISTTTPSGSGITAITGPTGLTFSGTPTSVGTLASGFSIKQLPTYTVCSSGCGFTTIQAALNAASSTNGTNGGATIDVLDGTYAQGSTGLLIKSPNTWIQCNANTIITFTGAITGFASGDAAYQFSNVNITGCQIQGDGTAGGIAIDWSNMSHSTYSNNTITTWGTGFNVSDTQNITFYNTISNNNLSTISQFGINASSTNAVNGNLITNNFIGCSSASCVGMQFTNANGNTITKNSIEPASANNTVDIKIFDNSISTCNGVFNNTFSGNYMEGGKTTGGTQGYSIAANLCVASGIWRNTFEHDITENHALDWSFPSATSTIISLNTFNGEMNSNYDNPLNSFQGPFGVGTSTELSNINTTNPTYTFFGISPQAGIATNDFTIGSTSNVLLNINNAGQVQVDNGGQINQVTSGSTIPLQVEANSSGDPIALSVFDSGFANTASLVKINQVNSTDSGAGLEVANSGTGPSIKVDTGTTTTPHLALTALRTSTAGNAVCILTTGTEVVTAGAVTCATSSKYTKYDIRTMDGAEAMKEVMALQPVLFDYIDGGRKDVDGVIAEQAAQVAPGIVTYAATTTVVDGHTFHVGDPYAVDPNAEAGLLFKAVQYEQGEILKGVPVAGHDAEDNWQWGAIGLLILWNLYLTLRKK